MSFVSVNQTLGASDGTKLDGVKLNGSKSDGSPTNRPVALPAYFLVAKRLCDLALAVLLLPLTLCICLVVAVLNPFLNPGPLFFVQTRIGKDEKPFRIIKLRTMTGTNDSARLSKNEADRISRFGTFLRTKRIDELPQILNVVRGDMSFIGPRPEQRELYEEILESIPEYSLRQAVKPGISGLAQVEVGYARGIAELREKLQYDLRYMQNMGFAMDLYVIGRTFKVLVTGFGAR